MASDEKKEVEGRGARARLLEEAASSAPMTFAMNNPKMMLDHRRLLSATKSATPMGII